MRLKRAKQYKRHLALYNINFGFRQPYQVILDGNFLHKATKLQVNLMDALVNIFNGHTVKISKFGLVSIK